MPDQEKQCGLAPAKNRSLLNSAWPLYRFCTVGRFLVWRNRAIRDLVHESGCNADLAEIKSKSIAQARAQVRIAEKS